MNLSFTDGHGTTLNVLEKAALEGAAAVGSVRIDRAAFVFESGTGLDEERCGEIVVEIVDFEAHGFEVKRLAAGREFNFGEKRTVAAKAAARAKIFGHA